MSDTPQYFRKAVMFGSLKDGGSMQIHGVLAGTSEEDAVSTGISVVAVQLTRGAAWQQTFTFRDRDYPTMNEALNAWKESQK